MASMQSSDVELIKDIPGYKFILKTVLRCQIQQLVEQLAQQTEEESVILTANVSDGTLCHLGSSSGKVFLDDHDDIKSQFLGFCLKRKHQLDSLEKEKQSSHQFKSTPPLSRSQIFPAQYSSPKDVHPVSLVRAGSAKSSPRHRPYHAGGRPHRINRNSSPGNLSQSASSPNDASGPVIKIEPLEKNIDITPRDEVTVEAVLNTGVSDEDTVQSNSLVAPVADQSCDLDETASSIPLDTNDYSDIEGRQNIPAQSADSDITSFITSHIQSGDLNVSDSGPDAGKLTPANIKVEAISEADLDLEITGVEPAAGGEQMNSSGDWDPGSMDYSQGASGSLTDLQGADQGYISSYAGKDRVDTAAIMAGLGYVANSMNLSPVNSPDPNTNRRFPCMLCDRAFTENWQLTRHMRIHTGEKPYKCDYCNYRCARKDSLRIHVFKHQKILQDQS